MKHLILPLIVLASWFGLSPESCAQTATAATEIVEAAPAIDSGNTAWILTATALVLFMTIPGLSLFYGGLVRHNNVLSVLMHCFVMTCVMSVIWLAFGYSVAFTEGCSFSGGFDKAFLKGVNADSVSGTLPELVYFGFQMTFFIITPALMIGAWVERMKFSAMLFFSIFWAILVYLPICHMVWGGGTLFGITGIIDHAGGIVVHITAGVGALDACVMVGKRTGFPHEMMIPHSLPLTVAGTGMLWVGWYGFNAGSGLAADGAAGMTLVVTHTSASVGAIAWMVIEWIEHKKPSMLGIATGSIAGLAAITPASGAVGPLGAIVIGAVSGSVCYIAATRIKQKFKYDDSLDVFGVHGVGGIIGTVLVAVFASQSFGGNADADFSISSQLGIQLAAAAITAVYTGIVSIILLKLADVLFGLRVTPQEEHEGLDLAAHGETGYNS